MQQLSQMESFVFVPTAAAVGGLRLGKLTLFLSSTLVVLAFIPLVPPVDVLEGGITTRGFIEFGLMIAGLLFLATHAASRQELWFDFRAPAFVLVSVFTFWAVLSSIWSPNPILTVAKSAELWGSAVVAAMLVALAVRMRPKANLAAVLGLSLVAVVAGMILANVFIWGTALPNTGDAALPLDIIDEELSLERPRLLLAYAHPLLTGDLLSLAVICLVASNLRRVLKVILIPGLLVLLWLTDARGPTGGLIVALIAMTTLMLRRNDVRALVLMLTLSSCLAVALVFQNQLPAAVAPLISDDVPTLNSRTDLWERTVTHIFNQPVLGTGYYGSRYVLVKDFYWAGHAHNSFLEVQLTTGLIGSLMLIGFVMYLFKEIVTTRNVLLLGVTLHCLIQGMLNPLLFYPGLAMFVVTVAALNARADNDAIGSRAGALNSGVVY
jgi:O-antigen ligase